MSVRGGAVSGMTSTLITHQRAAVATTTVLAALGIALEVTVIYRAATQSITYDEAGTYLKFLRGSFTDVFTHYDASNHVLFTALARVSIGVFGESGFSLRLPSVIGAAGFFVAIAAVCRRLFGHGVLPVLAVATVALDPLVLDLMSAARGYGFAFSLLTIALYWLTLALDGDAARLPARWGGASVALGLATGAQLTFAIPAVALAVAAAFVRPTAATFDRRSMRQLPWLVIPGVVVAATILVVPLRHVPKGAFSYGAQGIGLWFTSMIQPVFDHRAPSWACAVPEPNARVPVVAAGVCVVLTAFIGVALFVAFRRGAADRQTPPMLARFTMLSSGALFLSLLQVFVMHAAFGFRYPQGRTALYMLLLFPIAASSAVAVLLELRPAGIRGRAGALLLAVVSVWFLSEFTVTYFYEWRFDAGTRRIVDIVAEHAERSGRPLRVWAGDLEPSISFYRAIERSDAIAPMPDADTPPAASYDLFVACSKSEREATATVGRWIYVDPVSAAVLVEKQ
jgi:uncharacterized membrane protein